MSSPEDQKIVFQIDESGVENAKTIFENNDTSFQSLHYHVTLNSPPSLDNNYLVL